MDGAATVEKGSPTKTDSLIQQVNAARQASQEHRDAVKEFEIKSNAAKSAGLPLPEGEPKKNPQIELGEKLDEIGSKTLAEFEKAQRKWIDSGQKDHSALDEVIASLSKIQDPLEQYEAASAAIVQFMERTDFPLSDVLAVAKICPVVLHHSGLVNRLITEVGGGIGSRIEYREGEQQNYQSQAAFLDTISGNAEYLNYETMTHVRLYRGIITSRQIDKVLKSIESQSRGWVSTIGARELMTYLGLSEKAGITENMIGNANPTVLEVPAIVARLSRETLDPATRENLQGVTVGLAESMLKRRPEGAFEPRDRETYTNLMKAAFNGLVNLNNPDEVIYFDWLKSNRNTPLGKIVAKLDEKYRTEEWRKLTVDQSSKVREIQEQVSKAEVQKVEEARNAEEAKAAEAEKEEARLKAETEKKARISVVTGFRDPRIQSVVSRIGFDSPESELQAVIAELDQLASDNSDLTDSVNFARDVLNQFRQLSASSGNIISRTFETVVDRPGIAGIGRKTYTETRYGLNDVKFNEVRKSARDSDKEQFDFTQQAILEALNLIHSKIYPPVS